MNIKRLITKLSNFFLVIFIILTVLPVKLNYSSIAIIILVLLSISNIILFKSRNQKSIKYSIFIVSIPLIVYIFGLINTKDIKYGIDFLSKSMSFLAFPLIFFSLSEYIKKEKLFKYFLLGLFITNLYLIYLFFYYINFGLKFYKIVTVDIYHSTYLGMYSLFAYWICINLFRKKDKKALLLLAIFFLFSAIICSSRIIFILSLISVMMTLISAFKSNFKKVVAVVFTSLVFIIAMLSIPSTKQKFNQFLEIQKIGFDKDNYRSLSSRFAKIEASIAVLKDNIWIGTGTGDAEEKLVQQYKKMNFTMGYKKRYNPHNQYLDNLTRNGLIGGIISLLVIYLFPFYISIKSNEKLLLAFILIIAGVSLTESILVRHRGIVFYAFFVSLMLNSVNASKSINNKLLK